MSTSPGSSPTHEKISKDVVEAVKKKLATLDEAALAKGTTHQFAPDSSDWSINYTT